MSFRVLPIVCMLLVVACSAEPDAADRLDETPGDSPWHDGDEVTCASSDDCLDGESCEGGVCVMARCTEAFASRAPLGNGRFFGTDGEIAIVSDGAFVDAFNPHGVGAYVNSWEASNGNVVDVAGGNLRGTKSHVVAVAIEFDDRVRLNDGTSIAMGIWPVAIAAGDADADGIDELVGVSEDGAIALCHVDEDRCESANIADATGKDIAVADVDGDGYFEPVLVLDAGDASDLVVWNYDADETGQEESLAWRVDFPVRAASAGDLDGDHTDEIVMLEDGGWWGWSDDKLHSFNTATEALTTMNITGHTMDVAVGDRDSDDKDEIVILRDDKHYELMELDESAQLTSVLTAAVTVGDNPERVSIVDWDADSSFGELVDGPELVAGNEVPTTVMMFPPYPNKASRGAFSAKVEVGSIEDTTENHSETVSLGVGIGLSFGAEAAGFKASIGVKLSQDVSVTKTLTTSMAVGSFYAVHANPDLYGTNYGAVVLSCGCYHRYRYRTHDPNGLIGGSGQEVDIFIPVGGQTQLWSTTRYNAVAEASGRLPYLNVPVRVGDVDSYPATPTTLDGEPIAAEDNVFPNLPSFPLSDIGYVKFNIRAGESETNSVSTSTTVGVNSSFGALGVSVESSISLGVRHGYSVNVGSKSIFSGSIPPVPDDPETPEDEFEIHRFSFQPVIYRHRYVDQYGEDGGFYVMHFTAAR